MLNLAADLQLPLEAVTQTFAFLAKRGVGKTYAASVLVEEFLKHGLPVIVLDPLDVWWGLRANHAGDAAGFPIVVLGGNHADLPLQADMGTALADVIVEEGISAVLSLRHLSKTEQRKFVTDFAERLYYRKGEDENRTPLHLVIDECDAYIPQKVFAGMERLVGAIDDWVRRGRSSGLGVTLISQRAAVVNKDVLTQIEVLVALRTISPQDRKAMQAWIAAHDVHNQKAEFLDSLASLPIGTAWFWSPGWLEIFQRVQIRSRETFDSSATPKLGAMPTAPQRLATVDLSRLQQRLEASPDRSETDPAIVILKLKQEVARLQKLTVERVEVPVLPPDQIERLEAAIDSMQAMSQTVVTRLQAVQTALTAVKPKPTTIAPSSVTQVPLNPAVVETEPTEMVEAVALNSDRLSALEQRILNAIAMFEFVGLTSVNRRHVAIFADASPRLSGHFKNTLSSLRSRGFLEYPNAEALALTVAGRDHAHNRVQLTTNSDLHEAWFQAAKLPVLQQKLLRVLVSAYPKPLDRKDVARAVGLSDTESGHFKNNLGALRSLKIIDYPNPKQAIATTLLFPLEKVNTQTVAGRTVSNQSPLE